MGRASRGRKSLKRSGAAMNPVEDPDRKFVRDMAVKGIIGVVLATQVDSLLGALGLAVVAEIGVAGVGAVAPGLYPPDPTKTLAHRVAGVGATLGGWGFGHSLQCDPFLDDE